MTTEVFSQFASGIQSLVIAASVIVGGIWALCKLGLMQQIKKAKAELELLNRRLKEIGVMQPKIEAKQIGPVGGPVRCALVEVSIHNGGNRTEIIDWEKATLTSAKIEQTGDGTLKCGQPFRVPFIGIGAPVPPRTTTAVQPDDTAVFPFLVPFKDPGIYHLAFIAEASPAQSEYARQEHEAAGIELGELVFWEASTYFCVEGNASENK